MPDPDDSQTSTSIA